MNKRKFWLLIAAVSVLMVLVFLIAGCMGEVTLGETAKKEVEVKEEPNKELFGRYFLDMGLGGARGFFGGVVEENVSTFLPHQEACLSGGFKNKENFIFRSAVLDLETNDFIERCDMTISSDGSDGFVMEVLEWTFLRPGSYEYRVYVEDTLVAVLPFKVIPYVDYFFGKLHLQK